FDAGLKGIRNERESRGIGTPAVDVNGALSAEHRHSRHRSGPVPGIDEHQLDFAVFGVAHGPRWILEIHSQAPVRCEVGNQSTVSVEISRSTLSAEGFSLGTLASWACPGLDAQRSVLK